MWSLSCVQEACEDWAFDVWKLEEAVDGHALSCLGYHLFQVCTAGQCKQAAFTVLSPARLAKLMPALMLLSPC